MIICDSGRGVHPDDIGKPVILLDNRPANVKIENDLDSYNTYFKSFKDIVYETGSPFRKTKDTHFRCSHAMLREPTQEEIKEWGLYDEIHELLITIL